MSDQSNTEFLTAIDLWHEYIGRDPSTGMVNLELIRADRLNREVQLALDLDPSGVIAEILFARGLEQYFVDMRISVIDAATDTRETARTLGFARKLMEFARRPSLNDLRDRLAQRTLKAVQHYDLAEAPGVKEVLAQPDNLAELWCSALVAMKELHECKFVEGQRDPVSIHPQWEKSVRKWDTIANLVAALPAMKSGASLNLIDSSDDEYPHFAFGIRNGANIYVLHDGPVFAHPLQRYMSRRPDRKTQKRAEAHWFPYDLLRKHGVSDEDEASQGTVVSKVADNRIAEMKDLPAATIIWLSVMIDRIGDRYWRQPERPMAISYTSDSIKQPMRLSESAKAANLPMTMDARLELKPVAHVDVTSGAIEQEKWIRKDAISNAWLEDRYAHRVPVEGLNLLSDGNVYRADGTTAKPVVASDWMPEDDQQRDLKPLAPTFVGTAEDLRRERLFIARHNLAVGVATLAAREFREKRDEVAKWWTNAIRKNQAAICGWAAYPELWVACQDTRGFARYLNDAGGVHRRNEISARRFMRRIDIDRRNMSSRLYEEAGGRTLNVAREDGTFNCAITGAAPSHAAIFSPANPQEMALLAGVRIEDLPVFLQNVDKFVPYGGNCILEAIDPMQWVVENPWQKLPLQICIPLSKRGLTTLLDPKTGLPKAPPPVFDGLSLTHPGAEVDPPSAPGP